MNLHLPLQLDSTVNSDKSKLRISVTNLSLLAMPDVCEVCWLTLAKINWKKPFSRPLPAVMQYLDRIQKLLIAALIRRDQKLPKCFGPFQKSTGVAPISRLELFPVSESGTGEAGWLSYSFEF